MDTEQTQSSTQDNIINEEKITTHDKNDAMAAYLMMFASASIGGFIPFMSVIASVVYYFIVGNKSHFVKYHSLQSLLSQLPITIINSLVVLWLIIRLLQFFGFIVYNLNFSPTEFSFRYFFPYFPFTFVIFLIIFVICMNLFYFVFSIIAALYAYKGKIYYIPIFGKIAYNRIYGKKIDPPIISTQNTT